MSHVVQFDSVGGPEVLKIRHADVLLPGNGEVRMKVRAIGLNRAEALFRSGAFFEQPIFPAKIGYEAAGIIDAVGPNCSAFKIGDAVSVIPSFSLNDYGTYGEAVLLPERSVVKHPTNISFEEAAAIWMAYLTAYDGLIGISKLSRGEFAVISAASSSVGIAAIQIANAVGAFPIALTRTSRKAQQLREIGARRIIATEECDIVEEIAKLTGGKGVPVIFDAVGGPNFARLLESAAPRAHVIIYGTLGEPTVMPHFPIFTKSLTITGTLLVAMATDAERLKAAVDWILRFLEVGTLKPVIARTFPLDQIVEAHRYMESSAQFGKLVVTV
jgi:NADPH:quinone reductase-like Zn-dependent oxidoreductase